MISKRASGTIEIEYLIRATFSAMTLPRITTKAIEDEVTTWEEEPPDRITEDATTRCKALEEDEVTRSHCPTQLLRVMRWGRRWTDSERIIKCEYSRLFLPSRRLLEGKGKWVERSDKLTRQFKRWEQKREWEIYRKRSILFFIGFLDGLFKVDVVFKGRSSFEGVLWGLLNYVEQIWGLFAPQI